MKALIRLILSISLIFQAPVWALADAEKITHTQRYTFQKSLIQRVQSIMEMNLQYLRVAKECFAGERQDGCDQVVETIRHNINQMFPKFHRHVFNYTLLHGDRFEILMNAYQNQASRKKQGEEDFYFDPVNTLLSGVFGTWQNPLTQSLDELVPEELGGLIDTGVFSLPTYEFTEEEIQSHLNVEWDYQYNQIYLYGDEGASIGNRLDPENARARIISDTSVTKVKFPYSINGYLELLCQDFFKLSNYDLDSKSQVLCDRLTLTYSAEKGGFHFPNAQFDDQDDYLLFMKWRQFLTERGRRHYYSSQLRLRFFKEMAIIPYVALVNHTNPTDKELTNIFTYMVKNAEYELAKLKEKRKQAETDWEVFDTARRLQAKTLREFEANKPANMDNRQKANWGRRRHSLSRPIELENDAALSFMSFGPVLEDLIENPSYKMELLKDTNWETISEDLLGRHMTMEMKRIGLMVAGAVAAGMFCLVPIGKIPRVAKMIQAVATAKKTAKAAALFQGAGKILCASTVALGVNGFFIYDTFQLYKQTHRRFFSTKAGSTLLTEVESLDEAARAQVLELMMFPMGVLTVKQAVAGVKRVLSLRSQQQFKKGLKKSMEEWGYTKEQIDEAMNSL